MDMFRQEGILSLRMPLVERLAERGPPSPLAQNKRRKRRSGRSPLLGTWKTDKMHR
jgi:hypothetical protein